MIAINDTIAQSETYSFSFSIRHLNRGNRVAVN